MGVGFLWKGAGEVHSSALAHLQQDGRLKCYTHRWNGTERTDPDRSEPNGFERNRTKPNRSGPERTQPNGTEPNRIESNRAESDRTEPNRTDSIGHETVKPAAPFFGSHPNTNYQLLILIVLRSYFTLQKDDFRIGVLCCIHSCCNHSFFYFHAILYAMLLQILREYTYTVYEYE